MRLILSNLFVLLVLTTQAQMAPGSFHLYPGYSAELREIKGTSTPAFSNKKWFVSRYSGLSTGYSFFNGGDINYVSIPLGLQLSRRLNNNWSAFAGLSVSPSYVSFRHSFLNYGGEKGYSTNNQFTSGRFGGYSSAELGLRYISNDKAFSVSGSIHVYRSTYPGYLFLPVTPTSIPPTAPKRQ